MTPGVITCRICGNEARAGLIFCPACSGPLQTTPDPSLPPPGAEPDAASPFAHSDAPSAFAHSDAASAFAYSDAASAFAYTDSWDSVLPRLQAALFGEFVISRELGRGGMAAVFLAHQIKLDRKVAIKVMAPTLMSGIGLVDRFRVEATTVARLDHPNIIAIYEIGAATGLQYFIMQYVSGRSLERVIRQYGGLPLTVTQAIVFEVGNALAYAHRHRVIHRDVKPGNILLSLHGRVIVSDFGIAKVAESSARTETGAVVGTPAYMSPEQCLGKELTPAADQYALGIVAYEMLTGVQPFRGNPYAVMRGHTEEPVPPLTALRPDCPPDVAAAVARMLEKKPADRFQSMSEALAAMGASRMSMDPVQDMIGRLAVRLPDEEGIVLVHTPASPAPIEAPTAPLLVTIAPIGAHEPLQSGESVASNTEAEPDAPAPPRVTVRDHLSRLRAQGGQAASRVMNRLSPVVRGIGPTLRRGRSFSGRSLGALRDRVAASSRKDRILVGGSATALLLTILVLSLLDRRPSSGDRQVATTQTATPDMSAGTVGRTTGIVDSTTVAPDSAQEEEAVDSLVVSADSAAPSDITVRFAPRSRQVVLGDTVRFDGTVVDLRGRRVPGARVRWSVSNSSAVIDSNGVLITRRAGAVRVIARSDSLPPKTVQLTVVQRTVATTPPPDSGRRVETVGARTAAQEAAEEFSVDSVVSAFVRDVLNSRDQPRIQNLYRSRGPQDAAALEHLFSTIRDKRGLQIRPHPRPDRPAITGNRATSDVRIGLRWRTGLRGNEESWMMLHADMERGAVGWEMRGFRLATIDGR